MTPIVVIRVKNIGTVIHNKMREFLRVWKYALGSFNDDTTHKYDNAICIIRTVIMLQLVVTNCFIVSGVIRHWDKSPSVNISNQV